MGYGKKIIMNRVIEELYLYYSNPLNFRFIVKWYFYAIILSFLLLLFIGLLLHLFGANFEPFGAISDGVYN